jgi:heme exporter protein A
MSLGGTAPASCDFDSVSATDVSRHYGRRRALSGVSLDLSAGSITGLFGPNGAGKSTLLAILATLQRPSTGRVRYGSLQAAAWGDPLRGRIGVLGHDLFLYPDLTARENLRFFSRLGGLAPDEVERRIDAGIDRAGLNARRDDRVAGYSRGMRQRLAVERALLLKPRLVLLDEPYTGLDDASVERLSGRLRDLREEGAIVVMATHDFDVAEAVIDRAVCLQSGRLVDIPQGEASLRLRYRAAVEGAPA